MFEVLIPSPCTLDHNLNWQHSMDTVKLRSCGITADPLFNRCCLAKAREG